MSDDTTIITITLRLGNEAMKSKADVLEAISRAIQRDHLLEELTAPIQTGDNGLLFDGNGNQVGHWDARPQWG